MQAQASLKKFLEEIEKLYSSIDLFMLNLQKKLRLVIASEINPIEAFKKLKEENAWWKNEKKLENFYFAPSRSQKTFTWLFLDDIDVSKLQGYEAIIVQTSSNKYQAYIKLAKEVKAGKYKEIAKKAVKLFHADKAVVDEYHLRRLPNFLNTKYSPPFPITWYKQDGKALKIQAHRPPREWKKILFPKKREKRGGGGVFIKSWQEFAKPWQVQSLSEVDFAYACYLLSLGLSESEVIEKLKESPDLHIRHKNVQDYLARTVEAAKRKIRS